MQTRTANVNTLHTSAPSAPKPVLSMVDAMVLIVGIVVGAGIFKSPSVVAANTTDGLLFLGIWILGGFISLAGALCYSELTTAYPNVGGDYHFLKKAFGPAISFLFAWARVTVIQTGSIALLAYIIGDYLSEMTPIGPYGPGIYAILIVVMLTIINILGVQFGAGLQKILATLQFAGIAFLIVKGLVITPSAIPVAGPELNNAPHSSFGLALVFVLLTFGGWNEAAYISAELKAGSKKMSFLLIASILIITCIYLLLNWSFLKVLGLEGVASSKALGIDFMRAATAGETGIIFIGVLVSLAALTSLNTTIFTGARTSYALGNDFRVFAFLGKWHGRKSTPVNALVAQCAIAALLIFFGFFARDGFEAMVDFTAPVFWFFFLCSGISVIVLRIKDPGRERPFKVPLYPLTPLIFIGCSGYLLYSSLNYTGMGALIGVGVLAIGLIVLLTLKKRDSIPNKR